MATSKKTPQRHQPASADVSSEETHSGVQCEDIRLISSLLKPIMADKKSDRAPHFQFRIRAIVEGSKAYSYLEVLVNQFITGHPFKLTGFELSFVLMGTFIPSQNISSEDLADFVRFYTLTILWPYAREYATDLFRRTGINNIVLPIINPQVVTQYVIENNLVDVEIIAKRKPRNN